MTEQQTTSDYSSVSFPVDFLKKIDPYLKKYGYLNRADFIREAIREKLEKITVEA